MDRLFKNYIISIFCIILFKLIHATIANYWQSYIVSVVLIALLFAISAKVELMRKKEFLIMQLLLMSVFLILEVLYFATIILMVIKLGYSSMSFTLSPILWLATEALQILGYIGAIVCLVRYNSTKN